MPTFFTFQISSVYLESRIGNFICIKIVRKLSNKRTNCNVMEITDVEGRFHYLLNDNDKRLINSLSLFRYLFTLKSRRKK